MVGDGCGWISKGYYEHDRRDLGLSFVRLWPQTGATVVFKIPIYRELMLWSGCVDASKKTAVSVIKSGRSVYVLPGGEMEQMLTVEGNPTGCNYWSEGKHRVWLNTRKGFVRLAVEFGLDIIPIYAFGETDLFSVSDFLLPLRIWICKRFHVATPLAYSKVRGIPIPYWPRKLPVTICFGKAVKVKQLSPTDPNFHAEVDETHGRFISALQSLFERFKGECGYPDAVLEILPVEKQQ